MVQSRRVRGLNLLFDPVLDIRPSVSDVATDPEPRWSFPLIPPLVEGGNRHAEIVGELLDGEEPVPLFHTVDHGGHPVGSMSFIATAGVKGLMTLC